MATSTSQSAPTCSTGGPIDKLEVTTVSLADVSLSRPPNPNLFRILKYGERALHVDSSKIPFPSSYNSVTQTVKRLIKADASSPAQFDSLILGPTKDWQPDTCVTDATKGMDPRHLYLYCGEGASCSFYALESCSERWTRLESFTLANLDGLTLGPFVWPPFSSTITCLRLISCSTLSFSVPLGGILLSLKELAIIEKDATDSFSSIFYANPTLKTTLEVLEIKSTSGYDPGAEYNESSFKECIRECMNLREVKLTLLGKYVILGWAVLGLLPPSIEDLEFVVPPTKRIKNDLNTWIKSAKKHKLYPGDEDKTDSEVEGKGKEKRVDEPEWLPNLKKFKMTLSSGRPKETGTRSTGGSNFTAAWFLQPPQPPPGGGGDNGDGDIPPVSTFTSVPADEDLDEETSIILDDEAVHWGNGTIQHHLHSMYADAELEMDFAEEDEESDIEDDDEEDNDEDDEDGENAHEVAGLDDGIYFEQYEDDVELEFEDEVGLSGSGDDPTSTSTTGGVVNASSSNAQPASSISMGNVTRDLPAIVEAEEGSSNVPSGANEATSPHPPGSSAASSTTLPPIPPTLPPMVIHDVNGQPFTLPPHIASIMQARMTGPRGGAAPRLTSEELKELNNQRLEIFRILKYRGVVCRT